MDLEKECTKCNRLLPLNCFYNKRRVCRNCLGYGLGKKTGKQFSIPEDRHVEVVQLYLSGKSKRQVAEIFSCGYSTIDRILIRMKVQARPDNFKQLVSNERIFENIDTSEKAYWLGFLATDGNVYGSRIQFNLAERDRGHLEKWAKFIGCNLPIKNRTRVGIGERAEPYKLVSCAFRCKAMTEDLARHGILPNKSFTVKPWEGPDHLMADYWRGCVDGDGWVGKLDMEIGLCGNIHMVTGFERWVKNLVSTKANIRVCKKIYTFAVKAACINEVLYRNASIFLDRKREIAISYSVAKCPSLPSIAE